jgi:hypothetical protein
MQISVYIPVHLGGVTIFKRCTIGYALSGDFSYTGQSGPRSKRACNPVRVPVIVTERQEIVMVEKN